MKCFVIHCIFVGPKVDLADSNGLRPERTDFQSSTNNSSKDQPPFNEWHPHRMKTGLRNHFIGKKVLIIGVHARNGNLSTVRSSVSSWTGVQRHVMRNAENPPQSRGSSTT